MSENNFSESELEIIRKYNLTFKIAPLLDRHLVYPLIEFLGNEKVYEQQVVDQLAYDLLKDTYMVKYIKDLLDVLKPDQALPQDLVDKETFVANELERLNSETQETLNILSQKEVQDNLKQDKNYNREYLEKEHGINEDKINALYEFGQLQYNRGDYVMASDLLNNFRVLSTNTSLIVNCTWGRLALQIIDLDWEKSLEELSKLREVIDSRSFSDPLTQLYHRTWIIHWSLFIFFNIKNGLELLCDLFFSSSYLSTIQASCPWILRYLIVGVISKPHNKKLKDLIRIVSQEQYEYNDPLTDFIKALYIDFDFQEAKLKLEESILVVKTDFFLSHHGKTFLESAKTLVAEVYFKVHKTFQVEDITTLLDLPTETGKGFITGLLGDLKIDYKEDGDVISIVDRPTNVYQSIIDKTKHITPKTSEYLDAALQRQEA